MICLYCKTEIKGDPPLVCSGCEVTHQSRPPVVGVNHMSQLLSALDLVQEDEIDREELEIIFDSFVELLEKFEQKWSLRESALAGRLSGALQEKFADSFAQIDEALQLAYQGVELVEATLNEEAEGLEEAIDCFGRFFQGVCAAAAVILERLDEFEDNQGSGQLFNLPSV